MSVCPSVIPCARKLKLVPIPAVVSQNTNQSCKVCVKSEKKCNFGQPQIPGVHEARHI